MNSPEFHFIISAPRSGSTWLAAALNRHPEIFATEHRLFGQFCEMWPNNNGVRAPRITFDAYARAVSVHYFHEQFSESREQFQEEFISEYLRFLGNFAVEKTGKRILIDKITPYPGTAATVVEQLRKYFPHSKIFQLVRDGRDVATSGVFDWLLKDAQGTARHRFFVAQQTNAELNRFFDDAVLEQWASNWREVVEIFEQSKPLLTVRYEDMLQDQAAVLLELFANLQVHSTPQSAREYADSVTFEKMTGRARGTAIPTSKQRVGINGDWKRYFTRHDGELFHSIAGPQLLACGYASDANWFVGLPEKLTPDSDRLVGGGSQP